jgi:hypothetical protein
LHPSYPAIHSFILNRTNFTQMNEKKSALAQKIKIQTNHLKKKTKANVGRKTFQLGVVVRLRKFKGKRTNRQFCREEKGRRKKKRNRLESNIFFQRFAHFFFGFTAPARGGVTGRPADRPP